MDELDRVRKENQRLRQETAIAEFNVALDRVEPVAGVPVLTVQVAQAGADTLRTLADNFRRKHPAGIAAIGSVVDEKPLLVVTVSDDLIARGLRADELAKSAAKLMGGGGGGRPNMAQAGGTDPKRLEDALKSLRSSIQEKLA